MKKIFFLFIIITIFYPHTALFCASDAIRADYFFNEPCGSCSTDSELYMQFYQLAKEAAPGTAFEVFMHNTFVYENYNLLQQRYDEFEVEKQERSDMAIFIGESMLNKPASDEEITAFIISAANEFSSPSLSIPAQEAEDAIKHLDMEQGLVRSQSGEPLLVYFYITACTDCLEAEKVFEQLPGEVKFLKFNVAEEENVSLVRQYFDIYNVPSGKQKVPILFIGDNHYSAADITYENVTEAIAFESALRTYLPGSTANAESFSFQWGGVFITGFLNGLNPCGLSMFLFFISLISARGKNILKNGLAYAAGKAVIFFTIGTAGYYFFISAGDIFVPWLQTAVKITLALIGFAMAAFYINDYLAAKNEQYQKIRLQLPDSLRRANHRLIKKFNDFASNNSPKGTYLVLLGCFFLGMAVSAGEFLCTGQIYIASIIYAVKNIGGLRVNLYFTIYVFAVILPSILLLLLLWRGKTAFEVSETVRGNMHRIKLASGIFFFIFSIYILIWG